MGPVRSQLDRKHRFLRLTAQVERCEYQQSLLLRGEKHGSRVAEVHESLIYAAGVALSPLPVASILVILTTRRARANGMSFAGGWIAGLALAGLTAAVVVQALGLTVATPLWLAITEVAVGAAFLTATALVWLRRDQRVRRTWLAKVELLTAPRAAAVGTVLAAANPKVYALSLGAALAVAKSNPDISLSARSIAVFVAVGAASVLLPLGLYVALPHEVAPPFASFRAWLMRNETVVLLVLGSAIAAVFIASGLSAL